MRTHWLLSVAVTASLLAACSSKSVLNEHQLHTLLECPCPTIAPLAIYTLPGEVPFGYNAYIDGITSGPDGNIWVVESDANKIARVTASGTITEFLVPAAGAYPAQIAPGPDGNLWFTEFNFNTIGRITTEGVITEFALPPPLAGAPQNLYGIAAGPDGNMWFTHYGANVVGAISTTGTLVGAYTIPTANSGVVHIVKGPDGNMWFAEAGEPSNCVNNIAKVTMSGAITEYTVPTPSCNGPPGAPSAIGGMTVGKDGNIWFTERFNHKIARVTPHRRLHRIPRTHESGKRNAYADRLGARWDSVVLAQPARGTVERPGREDGSLRHGNRPVVFPSRRAQGNDDRARWYPMVHE